MVAFRETSCGSWRATASRRMLCMTPETSRSGFGKCRPRKRAKRSFSAARAGREEHRLRTRAGHCVQCDIKKLAFLRRHTKPAFVYIAGSLSGRVLKIGSSGAPWTRVERLGPPRSVQRLRRQAGGSRRHRRSRSQAWAVVLAMFLRRRPSRSHVTPPSELAQGHPGGGRRQAQPASASALTPLAAVAMSAATALGCDT